MSKYINTAKEIITTGAAAVVGVVVVLAVAKNPTKSNKIRQNFYT